MNRKTCSFFEKKNQKTFVYLVPRKAMPTRADVGIAQAQKFFGSFFQRIICLLTCDKIQARNAGLAFLAWLEKLVLKNPVRL